MNFDHKFMDLYFLIEQLDEVKLGRIYSILLETRKKREISKQELSLAKKILIDDQAKYTFKFLQETDISEFENKPALAQLLIHRITKYLLDFSQNKPFSFLLHEKIKRISNSLSDSGKNKLNEEYNNLINKGNECIKNGKPKSALSYFDKAIALQPAESLAYENKAVALAKLKLLDKAILLNQKALELNPDSANIYFNLGLDYKNLGDEMAAIKAFLKTIEIEPKHDKAIANLILIYEKNNSQADLEKMLTKLYDLKSDNLNLFAISKLSKLYFEKKQYDKALSFCKEGIEIDPDNSECRPILTRINDILDDKDAIDEDLSYFRQYKEEADDLTFDVLDISEQLIEKGKYEDAIIQLTTLISKYPDEHKPYFTLAECYFRMESYSEALELLEDYVKIAPSDVHKFTAYTMIGKIKGLDGNFRLCKIAYSRAIELLEKIIQSDPYLLDVPAAKEEFSEAYCTIGALHYDEENFEKAFTYYKQSVDYNVNHDNIICYLEVLLKLKNYTLFLEAEKLINDKNLNSDRIFYDLACGHAEQSNIDKSIHYLKLINSKEYKLSEKIRTDTSFKQISSDPRFIKFSQNLS